MTTQHGSAYILDTRDGSIEQVVRIGASIHEARSRALEASQDHSDRRNQREGYNRFVPLSRRAKKNLC